MGAYVPAGSRNKNRLYRTIGISTILITTLYCLLNGTSILSGQSTSLNSNKISRGTSFDFSPYINENDNSENYKFVRINENLNPNNKPYEKKVKATFVTLARNSDLHGLLEPIKAIEDRFNKNFHYDWVFLNDVEFDEDFKRITSSLISGNTKYGVIPKEHWSVPSWIDEEKATNARKKMEEDGVIYGGSLPYRHMCRFESGFFYRHPLLDEYEYYWRIEPDVKFHCDINYDIFQFMKDNNKKYGFTISIHEYEATIKTLWNTTLEFIDKNPEFLAKDNMLDFISDDDGTSYNNCHFWSNFEIASLDLWRGEAYSKYFDYLDKKGGFFYERWGDAPVHSIAAALFLNRDEIHHFYDVGYYHGPFHACPVDDQIRFENRCACSPNQDFTWQGFSCTTKYYNVNRLQKPHGWQKYAN
ncbi:hypothetical protein TBLA_0C00180 [Henningerozyma blattae CBS 6284]|uniref:Glycosyltransferase family 15 protein n=1 Tax=Henningerozyma blattae (strain ATCC 34711 / CBS 6284 / DSM 70876 / NBRC 10599 / NRRL Y-10934 / UCD 77-7) TaxID=1071380 RepID=I2H0D7_HENB6|nr:hypothetical protein TBLA_0C00180 [Tetrapisispora blattae CBS 6284]CCH59839.1 hypothetical protein TBLA_0C00180 [Tetrapisispora blattae CBS 6284]